MAHTGKCAVSDDIHGSAHRATLAAMPRLAPHLRGPAIALACAAAACLACAAAAWAQAPDLAPALPTTPTADPFASIAAAWGPSGASLFAVGVIWKEWRKDIADREKKVDDLTKSVAALEKQLALTQQSVAFASEALRRALDT